MTNSPTPARTLRYTSRERLTIRVTPATAAALREQAEERGLTLNTTAALILERSARRATK